MKKQKAGVKTGLKSKQSIKNWQSLKTVPQLTKWCGHLEKRLP